MPATTAVPIDKIRAGGNHRTKFDAGAISELALSIRRNGLMAPVTVRPLGDGTYEMVAGERRWRAHQELGVETIDAFVVDADDRRADTLMLIENVNRVNLDPIDEANAYQDWCDAGGTVDDLAAEIGKRASFIRSRISLLGLIDDIQHLISTGQIWTSFAQKLTTLDENRQNVAMLAFSRNPKMSLGEWDALVSQLKADQNAEAESPLFDLEMTVEEFVAKAKATAKPTRTQVAAILGQLARAVLDGSVTIEQALAAVGVAELFSGPVAPPSREPSRLR